MWCIFYPFAGRRIQALHLHWRRVVFLKVVMGVTTEYEASLNPAATHGDREAWDYSSNLLNRQEYSFR